MVFSGIAKKFSRKPSLYACAWRFTFVFQSLIHLQHGQDQYWKLPLKQVSFLKMLTAASGCFLPTMTPFLSYCQVLVDNGFPKDSVMVIAGLSNTYSSYVATYEEYQVLTYDSNVCDSGSIMRYNHSQLEFTL